MYLFVKSSVVTIPFLLLFSLFLGCGKTEEKSELDIKREQRETAWQQTKKDLKKKGDSSATYGPEMEGKSDERASERPREMKVAVIGPETGELAEYGIKTLEGVMMAAEEINASGGIAGKKVEVIHYDSKSTTQGAAASVEKLKEENVIAIIGSPTGEITFGVLQMANMHRIIFISAGTRRRLGDSGPFIFRNTLSDDIAVNRLMEYVIKKEGYRDFALVTSMSNDYSHQLSAFFKKEIFDSGSNLVADIHLWSKDTSNISEAETSIKEQIKEIKAKKPQAIIYTGDPEEGAQLMIEAKRQGLNVPMIGSEDLFSPEFIKFGKDAVVGSLLYTGYSPDWEADHLRRFVENYRKKKGKSPDKIVALGYDAFNMIAKGIADAGSTQPTKVRDAIMNIKDFQGVTGIISFAGVREPQKKPFLCKVVKKGEGYAFSLIGVY